MQSRHAALQRVQRFLAKCTEEDLAQVEDFAAELVRQHGLPSAPTNPSGSQTAQTTRCRICDSPCEKPGLGKAPNFGFSVERVGEFRKSALAGFGFSLKTNGLGVALVGT